MFTSLSGKNFRTSIRYWKIFIIYITTLGFYTPCLAEDILDNLVFDLASTTRYYINKNGKNQVVNNQFSYGYKGEIKLNTKFDFSQFKDIKFSSQVFYNWNNKDEERRYMDIRKANVYFHKGENKFGFGIDTFFWGASESINLVNVLNQSDISESIDGKVKLGQTFISVSNQFSNGEITFIYLPKFRAINFPQRPSYGLPISNSNLFENNKKDGGYAARALFYVEDYEFAFSYFKGTRRQPILIRSSMSPELLTPFYIQTENLLFDGVYLTENFTLKTEAKIGKELGDGFTAASFGIEYPSYLFSDVIDEVIFIGEYIFDDRKITAETHAQNDIFVGTKFEFGDASQSSLRMLYSYDLDYRGQYAELSYQHRFLDYFRVKAKFVKVLTASSEERRLHALVGEEFVKFSLHYAF
ncbi:hypothetical protein [Parashewanella tropica]|uniref:hypothetical protein n=1 Tax=Parashewanella tropica TaxID=2547970 RepID=UPI00105971A7|nr:hypothetical protein [Parashewanella tropica]